MEKLTYTHDGSTFEVDKDLAEKWLEREGIEKDTLKYHHAMDCVIMNAMGRIEGGREKDRVEKMMEEIMREELMLTGGQA